MLPMPSSLGGAHKGVGAQLEVLAHLLELQWKTQVIEQNF